MPLPDIKFVEFLDRGDSGDIEELDSGQRLDERRSIDSLRSHGRKIEKHGFHLVNGLSFAAASANDDR